MKESLLDDHCPVKYKVCLVADWLLGKVTGNTVSSLTPCGAEGTEPIVRFVSGKDQIKSWSLGLDITEVSAWVTALPLFDPGGLYPATAHSLPPSGCTGPIFFHCSVLCL